MELIYQAEPREIVLYLDLEGDLSQANLLLDTYGNFEDLTEDEVAARRERNARRVELFKAAYLATLRMIGSERALTVYVGSQNEATATPAGPDPDSGDSIERQVWQEAHDRTAVPDWDA